MRHHVVERVVNVQLFALCATEEGNLLGMRDETLVVESILSFETETVSSNLTERRLHEVE